MKKTIITVCTAALVASGLALAAVPANAAPPMGPPGHQHNHFEMRGHYAYYNGQRGDRHRHPGWRQYNGYWFPPAAFGAIIGGAILGGIIAHAH